MKNTRVILINAGSNSHKCILFSPIVKRAVQQKTSNIILKIEPENIHLSIPNKLDKRDFLPSLSLLKSAHKNTNSNNNALHISKLVN